MVMRDCSPRVQRWVGFTNTCLVLFLGGSYFLIGLLEEDMKVEFDLTQPAVELIMALGACCANLGYPWGLLLDHITDRTAFVIATVVGTAGGVLLYAADYLKQFYSVYWWLLGIYWAGVCSSFVIGYLVSISVAMENFPRRRQGVITGAINGCWWVGQCLFNYLYTVLLTHFNGRPEVGKIFLVIGVSVFVVKGLGAFLIRFVPMDDDDAEYSTLNDYSSTVRTGEADSRVAEYGTQQGVDAGDEPKESCVEKLGLQMFIDLDFHCIAWGFIIAVGADFMYIGNVASISASLSLGKVAGTTIIVAPIAALVFTFVSGWLSDCTRNVFPGSIYMVIGEICNAILFAICSVYGASSALFILTTLFIYGTSGMLYTFTGNIIGERFGMPHFKRNFGLVMMGGAAATLVTSSVFGSLYDSAIKNEDVRFCKGIDCLQNIFIVGCVLSLVSAACFTLFERRLIWRRFRRIM